MKNENKPWLDEMGKPLSIEAIKEVSGNWSEQTWENYLLTIEKPLKEKLLEPSFYDKLAAKQDETIFQKFCITPDAATEQLVKNLLAQLSPMQRTVIEKIFFDGLTERQTAEVLGISSSTVYVHKKNALSRIGRILEGGSGTLPYIGEHDMNKKDAFEKIDISYQEGSLTKDEWFRLWALAEVGGLKEGDLS